MALLKYLWLFGAIYATLAPDSCARWFDDAPYCYSGLSVQMVTKTWHGWQPKSLPPYGYESRDGRIQVEPGESYRIRVTNPTRWRVAVSLKVDGVNVLGPGEHLWVVSPFDTLEVVGWQKNMTTAAEFRVDDRTASYAEYLRRLGFPIDSRKIGMIEAVFYRDREEDDCLSRPMITKMEPSANELNNQGAAAENRTKFPPYADREAGTAAGDLVDSRISKVQMKVGERVKDLVIRYGYGLQRYYPLEKNAPGDRPSDAEPGWGGYLDN